jgi:hypothetical protein
MHNIYCGLVEEMVPSGRENRLELGQPMEPGLRDFQREKQKGLARVSHGGVLGEDDGQGNLVGVPYPLT